MQLSCLPRIATDFLCCNPQLLLSLKLPWAAWLAAGGAVIHQPSARALPLENHLQATVLHWHSKSGEARLQAGRVRGGPCSRQFALIDMNHYRQHGRGRWRTCHCFIFGHLFRQKLGQYGGEQGVHVSVCQRGKQKHKWKMQKGDGGQRDANAGEK